ncbi:MAG: histidinol-phosphate aminotransferase [Acidimicrobiaceae bacterium]|jgi:histidinol-phosphate aminotransferase|nr:histidinol-phosphate aminotransferase [Acidimicrobiaceae bacterium]
MGALIPVREDLGLFEGYHSPQVDVDVRLNTNESPYPPPAGWLDALHDAIAALPFHRYPDRRFTALRAGLAELEGVRPEQVFVANGSNEVLQTLLLAYGGPARTAAVFEPTYALHSHIATVTGTKVAVGERNHDFTLNMDDVARVMTDAEPAVTFLCSPNNPTGRIEPPEVVRAVLEQAPGLVVVDEAYGQFSRWSALELVDETTPLVVVRTFSKTWSMAAARLGYCVAPSSVVAALEQVVLPYHLDAMKQAAGTLALRFKSEMQARIAGINEERGRIAAAFADLPVDTWPSDANFVLFRPVHRDGNDVWQALLERSVLVRNCASWPRLSGCLRVTIGTPAENDRFLAALREVLQ